MKKFAIAAATATALTLTMANAAFAQTTQATQAPMTLAAGEMTKAKEATSDTWITTKVRSQLLGSDQVKSSNVKVTTENGEVFLLGLVTDREGKAAADIASRVSGVKHVTTAFTYIK